MSTCIKDLYDYELVRKCSKCGIICLNSDFRKNKTKNDHLNSICEVCRKQYYDEKLVKIKKSHLDNRDRTKDYYLENFDKIIACEKTYSNNIYKTDINFGLNCRGRSRIKEVLNGNSTSTSTKLFFIVDLDTYREWIEYQMNPQMNWSIIDIDHMIIFVSLIYLKTKNQKKISAGKIHNPYLKKFINIRELILIS